MKNLLIFTFIFTALSSFSEIWKSNNQWNTHWEKQYSKWAQYKLNKDLFISKRSPYYGIKADCADSLYVIRAIFAKENRLPFAIVDPSSVRNSKKGRGAWKLIDNHIDRFDYIKNEKERFVAFANFIGLSLGTDTLKYFDTYPIAINKIKPGDIFHFNSKKKDEVIRHSVMIKKIHGTGLFDTFYSTQEIKKNNISFFNKESKYARPLMYKLKQEFYHAPKNGSGGFRRFIWPRNLTTKFESFKNFADYSEKQFQLAESLSKKAFFRHVKSQIASRKETLNEFIERSLQDICQKSKERVISVWDSVHYRKKNQNRCLNYSEFDTYSTPLRDNELKESYRNFYVGLKDRLKSVSEVPSRKWIDLAFDVIKGDSTGLTKKFCSVKVTKRLKLDIADIKRKLFKGKMSSDPNQNLYARWGYTREKSQKCRIFYN